MFSGQIHQVSILLSPSDVTFRSLQFISFSYENLLRAFQARNEKVIAHRYVSKMLNWYQPNNKCEFDKCSYRRQKPQCFEEQNNSASGYPTAKLMFDS